MEGQGSQRVPCLYSKDTLKYSEYPRAPWTGRQKMQGAVFQSVSN